MIVVYSWYFYAPTVPCIPGSHLKYQFSQLAALKFFNGSSENLVLREQKILLWLLILLSLVAVILPTYLFYLLRLSKTCGL